METKPIRRVWKDRLLRCCRARRRTTFSDIRVLEEELQARASFPFSFNSIPNKVTWPYMQQWHLDVQHELRGHTVMTVSYVGSKGTHLGRQIDLNQLLPVSASQNPYKPGEPIGGVIDPNTATPTHDDCGTMTIPSGVAVTGQAAINLSEPVAMTRIPFAHITGFPLLRHCRVRHPPATTRSKLPHVRVLED